MYCDVLKQGWTDYIFILPKGREAVYFGAGLGHLSPFLVLWAISETISPLFGDALSKIAGLSQMAEPLFCPSPALCSRT